MKKFILFGLALIVAAVSCKQEPKQTESNGPTMTITCDETALMGDVFSFKVNLEDNVALSTLKVQLLFDEDVVAEKTIRTATNGVYEDELDIPFKKDIPDGNAKAVFTAQNTSFGVTTENKTVAVTRPDFPKLLLRPALGGDDIEMAKVSRNNYEVTAVFDAVMEANIITPAFGKKNRTISFGYGAAGIEAGAAAPIPFNGTAGEYTISFNTLTFEGAPFNTMTVNGVNTIRLDKNTFACVQEFTKGGDVKIEGYDGSFADWVIDPDYLEEVSAGNYKFLAPDGNYRFTIQIDKKFFLVEKVKADGSYDTLSADGSGTVWIIGNPSTYGKPAIFTKGTGWTPDYGLPMVESESKIHTITFIAGEQLKSDAFEIKFFFEKDWKAEFNNDEGENHYPISAKAGAPLKIAGGNVTLNGSPLTYGASYRFTLDLTSFPTSAVLDFGPVDGGGGPATYDYYFGGQGLSQLSATTYQATVSLTQGQSVSATGFTDIADWTIDSDFFETVSAGNYKLIPVSGFYKVTADFEAKYFAVSRASDAAGTDATLNTDGTGAVWMIGSDCFGKPVINTSSWSPSDGLCFAEVSPKVYHLTLVGGTQLAASGLNVKLFYQQGWGDEFGKAKYSGLDGLIDFHATDDGNIVYASGAKIELGATYQFILDLTEGIESASLELKKIKDSDIVADEVKVNGVKLDLTAEDHYEGILSIEKGTLMEVTGISSISDYLVNADLVDADGKFAAVSGYYKAVVDRKDNYITGYRVANAAGDSPNLSQGGVFLLGWGFSNISHADQPGWNPGKGAQMVEVSPKVFQFTGIAGPAEPAVVGVRVRDSGWDCKYFFQDGWGGEASKGVTILGNAASKIDAAKQADSGNLGLASDLEAGAVYRLTIDFSSCTIDGASITAGQEVLTFEKL
ncbi:MAG: DUF5121 domain-containing protein [Bacteroidales bacterium]|nr:DUF5121 domain-containing protein [Bacteroidales bacterium]